MISPIVKLTDAMSTVEYSTLPTGVDDAVEYHESSWIAAGAVIRCSVSGAYFVVGSDAIDNDRAPFTSPFALAEEGLVSLVMTPNEDGILYPYGTTAEEHVVVTEVKTNTIVRHRDTTSVYQIVGAGLSGFFAGIAAGKKSEE